tara:strand:- start:156 stop:770 length:615 start_codon:yes stop_codon:yes gene_type:complete
VKPKLYIENDLMLWQSFKSGDEAAFSKIYLSNYDSLYSYGKKFIGDPTLVEDAIQDLFFQLWKTKMNLSDTDNIKFYLFRCLRRSIHKSTIENERIGLASFEYISTLDFGDMDFNGILGPGQEELMVEKLKHFLGQLHKRQLEAISLRYYDNFSVSEISEIMNISEKTVRNTLYKALVLLKKNIPNLRPLLKLLLTLQWAEVSF